MNSPPASYFLKAAAGIEKGAQKPGTLRDCDNKLKIVLTVAEIFNLKICFLVLSIGPVFCLPGS